MPHIIVEYSESLRVDVPKLLSKLHYDLAEKPSVDVHAIKTRAIPVQYSIVGDGHENDRLIHVILKLMPGRDDALRKEMAESLHKITRKEAHDDRISVSVEVQELDAASYTK